MSSPDDDVFAALSRAFAALGARWYIFGAQAAAIHGAPRYTADVDVTVDGVAWSGREVVSALEREGIRLRIDVADDFVSASRVLPLVHESTDMPVDVVLSGPGLEERFFGRVVHREVDGILLPVVCAEDLVTMKVLAGRPKDLDDALSVLRVAGHDVDHELIRATLAELEDALGQSDLVPALEKLLNER